jgi:hypothetical protein
VLLKTGTSARSILLFSLFGQIAMTAYFSVARQPPDSYDLKPNVDPQKELREQLTVC